MDFQVRAGNVPALANATPDEPFESGNAGPSDPSMQPAVSQEPPAQVKPRNADATELATCRAIVPYCPTQLALEVPTDRRSNRAAAKTATPPPTTHRAETPTSAVAESKTATVAQARAPVTSETAYIVISAERLDSVQRAQQQMERLLDRAQRAWDSGVPLPAHSPENGPRASEKNGWDTMTLGGTWLLRHGRRNNRAGSVGTGTAQQVAGSVLCATGPLLGWVPFLFFVDRAFSRESSPAGGLKRGIREYSASIADDLQNSTNLEDSNSSLPRTAAGHTERAQVDRAFPTERNAREVLGAVWETLSKAEAIVVHHPWFDNRETDSVRREIHRAQRELQRINRCVRTWRVVPAPGPVHTRAPHSA